MAKKAVYYSPSVKMALTRLEAIRKKDASKHPGGVLGAIAQIRADRDQGFFTLEKVGTTEEELERIEQAILHPEAV